MLIKWNEIRGLAKRYKLLKNLNGILVKGNVAVALCWNGNSETWNKEAESNTFWFWEKIDCQGWVENWKKALARLYRKRQKMRCLRRGTSRFWIIRFNDWRNWKRKIIVICWGNWDGWFKSSRDLRNWKFSVIKKTLWSGSCERNRLKWVRIKTVFEP